jgi:hypothetical protein
MKALLIIGTILLTSFTPNPNDFFVGKWVFSEFRPFNDKYKVIDEKAKDYNSEFVFYKDGRFTQTINGESVNGKYALKKPNKIEFVDKDGTWTVRWPKNTEDPYPRTEAIDFPYPVVMMVSDEEGNEFLMEIDCLYKKVD